MHDISINGVSINQQHKCYIIAEVGNNHQGSLVKAKEMFKAAAECGVDAVKLQKRHNRSLYTRELYESPYVNENSFGETYGEHREALEFGREEYIELQAYAKELGLAMFATAFDFDSADFLADLAMPAYKIASGDLKNIPLLKHVAKIGKPMILSTGGATLDDVRRAYHAIMPLNQQLCILQCTAAYPAQFEDLNLNVIPLFQKQFPDAVIGLSDHENGIAMALVAYMLGARVLEKHFTLNHTWKGTDHAFSLEPAGMRKLVRDLSRVPIALGTGIKEPKDCEKKPLMKMGKKIVAARNLEAGRVLGPDDLAFKSPGDGLAPFHVDDLIGRTLSRSLLEEEALSLDAINHN